MRHFPPIVARLLSVAALAFASCVAASAANQDLRSRYEMTVETGLPSVSAYEPTLQWAKDRFAAVARRFALRTANKGKGHIAVQAILNEVDLIETSIDIQLTDSKATFSFLAVNLQLERKTYDTWYRYLDSIVATYPLSKTRNDLGALEDSREASAQYCRGKDKPYDSEADLTKAIREEIQGNPLSSERFALMARFNALLPVDQFNISGLAAAIVEEVAAGTGNLEPGSSTYLPGLGIAALQYDGSTILLRQEALCGQIALRFARSGVGQDATLSLTGMSVGVEGTSAPRLVFVFDHGRMALDKRLVSAKATVGGSEGLWDFYVLAHPPLLADGKARTVAAMDGTVYEADIDTATRVANLASLASLPTAESLEALPLGLTAAYRDGGLCGLAGGKRVPLQALDRAGAEAKLAEAFSGAGISPDIAKRWSKILAGQTPEGKPFYVEGTAAFVGDDGDLRSGDYVAIGLDKYDAEGKRAEIYVARYKGGNLQRADLGSGRVMVAKGWRKDNPKGDFQVSGVDGTRHREFVAYFDRGAYSRCETRLSDFGLVFTRDANGAWPLDALEGVQFNGNDTYFAQGGKDFGFRYAQLPGGFEATSTKTGEKAYFAFSGIPATKEEISEEGGPSSSISASVDGITLPYTNYAFAALGEPDGIRVRIAVPITVRIAVELSGDGSLKRADLYGDAYGFPVKR